MYERFFLRAVLGAKTIFKRTTAIVQQRMFFWTYTI